MKKLTFSIIASLFLSVLAYYVPKTPATTVAESYVFAVQRSEDSIILQRTVCFGTCPDYTVTITSDGTVTFEGRRFTKTTGTATGRISRAAFRRLVREFQRIKYFSLPDEYAPGTKVCPQMITDLPSANTAIQLKGKTKSVRHYHGCGSKGALAALTALENTIDKVAGTQKWIK